MLKLGEGGAYIPSPRRCCKTCEHFVDKDEALRIAKREQEQHDISDFDLDELKKELSESSEIKGFCSEDGIHSLFNYEISNPIQELSEEECCGWKYKSS